MILGIIKRLSLIVLIPLYLLVTVTFLIPIVYWIITGKEWVDLEKVIGFVG